MVSTILTGLLALTSIASALPQATTAGSRSCAQLGSGSTSGQYTITCAADRPGGDLSGAEASSFEACIPLCDALTGCVGFAYVGGSGTGHCYFKSSLTSQVAASNVDVAVKPVTATSSAPTPSSTAATACSQLGSTFDGYNVECKTDRAGGDLSNAQASSFAGCFPICDATPNCIGFSFVGGSGAGTCYLKTSLNPAAANQGVDTAVKPVTVSSSATTPSSTAPAPSSTAPTSCSQFGSTNRAYTVECRTDRAGGDLSNAQASSFAACFPICDATPNCIGFSFVGGSGAGTCYLKQNQNGAAANSGVDTAFRPSPATTAASSSTSAAPTSTAAPGQSCSQLGNGVSTNGYTSECGTDRAGGDFGSAQASSFSGCIPICNSTPGCVGFSYVGGANAGVCYLKNTLVPATSSSNVDGAVRNSAVSSSSSLVSSTTSSRSSTASSVSSSTSTVVSTTSSSVVPTTSSLASSSTSTVVPTTSSSVVPTTSSSSVVPTTSSSPVLPSTTSSRSSTSSLVSSSTSTAVPSTISSSVVPTTIITLTTSRSSTTTTTSSAAATTTAPSGLTYNLNLWSNVLCIGNAGALTVSPAQVGQCTSLRGASAFTYTTSGPLGCRLIAYYGPGCTGFNQILPGPVFGSSLCMPIYNSVRMEC